MLRRLAIFCVLSAVSVGTSLGLQQPDMSKPQQDTMNKQKDSKMQDMQRDKMSSTDMKLSSGDHEFIMKAAHGGAMEIELSQLAVSKSSNDDVKQFAQRLIDDHSKANDELKQLAQSKGVILPESHGTMSGTSDSTMNSSSKTMSHANMNAKDHQAMMEHQKMKEKLSKLSGAEFDKAYMSAIVKDHEKAVAMYEKVAKDSKDADVKAWATKTLPTLKEHWQMARDTAAKVGAKMGS